MGSVIVVVPEVHHPGKHNTVSNIEGGNRYAAYATYLCFEGPYPILQLINTKIFQKIQ